MHIIWTNLLLKHKILYFDARGSSGPPQSWSSSLSADLVSVLRGYPQRLRLLQADHERGVSAHHITIIRMCIAHKWVCPLLLRIWCKTELLSLLLLQVSEDGLGQEVRVILLFIQKMMKTKKKIIWLLIPCFQLYNNRRTTQ